MELLNIRNYVSKFSVSVFFSESKNHYGRIKIKRKKRIYTTFLNLEFVLIATQSLLWSSNLHPKSKSIVRRNYSSHQKFELLKVTTKLTQAATSYIYMYIHPSLYSFITNVFVTRAKNKIVIRNSILKLHPVRSKQPSEIHSSVSASSDTHTHTHTEKGTKREREKGKRHEILDEVGPKDQSDTSNDTIHPGTVRSSRHDITAVKPAKSWPGFLSIAQVL